MALLRRIVPSIVSIPSNNCTSLPVHHPRSLLSESIHSATEPKIETSVGAICDSLRRGWNWDTLTQRFGSTELNNSVVDEILLELKEPIDAKRALGFFHWSAQRKNFEHGIQSYCVAIHVLVRARLLTDARALLESVLKKSAGQSSRFSVVDSLLSSYRKTGSTPFVFDLLVQTYSKLRFFEIAFDVCRYLEEHGFTPSLISFNTLLHVVQKSDDQNLLVWKIYEFMIEKRRYPNEETIRIMISALCKEGKLQRYVDMLDRIHGKRCPPVMIVNTSSIHGILEEGRIEEGMVLLKRMLGKDMILDIVAYSIIVYAEAKLGNTGSACELFEEMLKRGFQANPFVMTSLIGAYCKEGKIEEATHLMQEMQNLGLNPYDETFNLLIEGCAKAGRVEESLSNCEKMVERGLVPSCVAFNETVGKLCERGDPKQANAKLTLLLDKGFSPDEITYSYLITGYGRNGEVQEVLKLYYEMEYRSLSPGLSVFSSLIRSLCRYGNLEEAERYLQIMKDRSIAPSNRIYEKLIDSHFEKGDRTRALQLHDEMVSIGLNPK